MKVLLLAIQETHGREYTQASGYYQLISEQNHRCNPKWQPWPPLILVLGGLYTLSSLHMIHQRGI